MLEVEEAALVAEQVGARPAQIGHPCGQDRVRCLQGWQQVVCTEYLDPVASLMGAALLQNHRDSQTELELLALAGLQRHLQQLDIKAAGKYRRTRLLQLESQKDLLEERLQCPAKLHICEQNITAANLC